MAPSLASTITALDLSWRVALYDRPDFLSGGVIALVLACLLLLG